MNWGLDFFDHIWMGWPRDRGLANGGGRLRRVSGSRGGEPGEAETEPVNWTKPTEGMESGSWAEPDEEAESLCWAEAAKMKGLGGYLQYIV